MINLDNIDLLQKKKKKRKINKRYRIEFLHSVQTEFHQKLYP